MSWMDIAERDTSLAGALAATLPVGSEEWDETMEQCANRVGLQGESREKFYKGWQDSIAYHQRQLHEAQQRELDTIADEAARRGDPAN